MRRDRPRRRRLERGQLPGGAAARRPARHRAGSRGWSTSARSAAIWPTCSRTLAEGVRGKRAVEWGLVDEAPTEGKFEEAVRSAASTRWSRAAKRRPAQGRSTLAPLEASAATRRVQVRDRRLDAAARRRRSPCAAPRGGRAATPDELARGRRERVGHPRLARARRRAPRPALQPPGHRRRRAARRAATRRGARGRRDARAARRTTVSCARSRSSMKRVLKRLDITREDFFALIEPGSCFAGSLARARARGRPHLHARRPERRGVASALSAMNAGPLPMANGLTRLRARFLGEPERVARVARARAARSTRRARSRRASSRSRPTPSTGTTRCASPSRSARASRPTR